MFEFLFHLSDVALFFIISGTAIFISIVAIFLVRHVIPLRLRLQDNAVLGNVCNLVSLIYGVLAGLTALYLINNLSYTSDAVQREANSVANIYRDAAWLNEPTQSIMNTELKKYLNQTINVEWPLMKDGKDVPHDGDLIINNIADQLHAYSKIDPSELLIQRDMLEEIKSLYNARQARISMSNSELSAEIWEVILIGTFLTLGINFLFGMNFYLHIFTVISAALMAASMIFLLLTLDRPFQGEFVIEPDALKSVLVLMHENEIAHAPAPVPAPVKP